ncbi:hypothetical protein BKA93DRAFT_806324 [Sparassis latifolia]
MATPKTFSYSDVLPPTSNMLDTYQRARLVRSARKLGAVLGSTPKLIEVEANPQPIPITLLPIGRIPPTSRSATPQFIPSRKDTPSPIPITPDLIYSSASSNSSMASLVLPRGSTDSERSIDYVPHEPLLRPSKHTRSRSKPLPKPLILRLNAVPTCPSDPRLRVTPATPLSPKVSPPTTPVPVSVAETRRRKMAKLQRTFGENIPVDAVFPSAQPYERPALLNVPGTQPYSNPKSKDRRQRSMSVDGAIAPQSVRRSSRVWITGSKGWTGEWNRKDIREVQDQLRTLKL